MIERIRRLKEYEKVFDRIVVYTAIFGGVDKLTEFETEPGIQYVCFTDTCAESSTWEIRYVPKEQMQDTPRKTARWYKTHPHELFPEATCVIWVDARLTLKSSVKDILSLLKYSDIAVAKHPIRTCLYKEAETCKNLKLDSPRIIDAQISRYRSEGYPVNNGLAETGCLVTRPCEGTRKMFDLWWQQIDTGSVRDQISFNYVVWKLGLKYSTINSVMINRGKHVHRHSPQTNEKVVIVLPYAKGNGERAEKIKRVMEIRAKIPCEVIPVEDLEGIGWVAIHNKMAKELDYTWYLYGCDDYFPSRGYLKVALEAAKKQKKHFVGFNDGKWEGSNFTTGLIHKSLIPRLYSTGTLFAPIYHFHGADPDLTARGKLLKETIYVPEAVLMEIDYEKDFKGSSRLNQEDVKTYQRRKKARFPFKL